MSTSGVNQSIADLLSDPMVQLMIHADRIDREALADDLRKLACRLESAKLCVEAAIRGACGL